MPTQQLDLGLLPSEPQPGSEGVVVPTELIAPENAADTNAQFPDHVVDQLLTPCTAIIRDTLTEQNGAPNLENPQEPPEHPQADKPLQVIEQVVGAIKDGRDLSAMKPDVLRLISNQEDRAQLISNLLMTHDYTRVAKYAKAREKLENTILEAIDRGRLTPTQTLAFLKLISEETEVISGRIRGGATSVKDLMALINRADYQMQMSEGDIHKKFTGTSPQGREIIRRLIGKLCKATASDARRDVVSD